MIQLMVLITVILHQTSVFNKLNTGIGNLGTSRSVSYSMTAGNWYRIASGAGRSCGDIYIQDGISGGPAW